MEERLGPMMYKKYFDMGRNIPRFEMKFSDFKPEPLIPPSDRVNDLYIKAINDMYEKMSSESGLPWWMLGNKEPAGRRPFPTYSDINTKEKPKVDADMGKGPVIDLGPEDYLVLEEQKMLKE
jgi:hypothetical protein